MGGKKEENRVRFGVSFKVKVARSDGAEEGGILASLSMGRIEPRRKVWY